MKKIIAIFLLAIVLSGCSGGEVDESILKKEISELKKENQELKEEISKLKNTSGEDKEVSDEDVASDKEEVNKFIHKKVSDSQNIIVNHELRAYKYQDNYTEDLFGGSKEVHTTEGKFIILEINASNIGKQVYDTSWSWTIIDDLGREYTSEIIFDKNKEKASMETRKITSGFDVTLYPIFEVPSDFGEIDRMIDNRDLSVTHVDMKVDLNELDQIDMDF